MPKRRHKKLTQYCISANSDHISMLDEIADLRCTTRAALIRESIAQFLIRELKSEHNRQYGLRTAKQNLDALTRGW